MQPITIRRTLANENANRKNKKPKTEMIEFACFRLPNDFERIEGVNYLAFNIIGDSMTDGTEKGIPECSMVLGAEIKLRGDREQIIPYNTYFSDIPVNKPLIIIGMDDTGKEFCILKTVCFIDTIHYRYLMHSYNPSFKDFWISVNRIERIFEVVSVKLPSGRCFIPEATNYTPWKNVVPLFAGHV
jgi:hypothetical protein